MRECRQSVSDHIMGDYRETLGLYFRQLTPVGLTGAGLVKRIPSGHRAVLLGGRGSGPLCAPSSSCLNMRV